MINGSIDLYIEIIKKKEYYLIKVKESQSQEKRVWYG
jgi:hypothetical protein